MAASITDIKALNGACRMGSDFFSDDWAQLHGREVVSDVFSRADGIHAYFVATQTYRMEDTHGVVEREVVRYRIYSVELTGTYAGLINQVEADFRDLGRATARARECGAFTERAV